MNDMKKVLIVAISVVLVIAIAAGVSIGVMANTMNGLKDRVEELDQAYASDKAAMMAEIEAAKAANENLVTAADFEAKLAAAIGEQNQTMQSLISTAVKNQIEDLEVEGLTEEQVQAIIDAAVANCLTEADIDAIIADVDTGLTKAEVKKIVADYTAGTLTYGQIVNLIDDADYDLRKFLEDQFTEELNKVIEQVNALGGDLGKLEQSTSSYVVDTAKKTVTIASAKGLVDWANDTNNGKSWHGYTITLVADIDLAGIVWEPVQIDWFDTIIFDGGYHIISNLTVESHVAVEDGGNKFVGFFGKVGAITVKDVTFDNADITAPAGDATYAGVVAAYAYDSVNSNVASYENIAVINSTIYGEDKCGGLLGFFGEEDFTMENITVTGCTIGSEKADAAGGVVGRVGDVVITVNDYACTGNTYLAKNTNKGDIVGKTDVVTVTTPDTISGDGYKALNADYGISQKVVMNNGVLNGNGHTIEGKVSATSYNAILEAKSGTIKNITVKASTECTGGAPRALYVTGLTGDVTVADSYFEGGYALNVNSNNDAYGLYVDNSSFVGWTSVGSIKEVEFVDCTFDGKKDNPYMVFSDTLSESRVRVYTDAKFDGCAFNGDIVFDADSTTGLIIEFVDCTVDGAKLSSANFATVLAANDDGTGKFVETMKACTITVDGIAVVWPTTNP